MNVTAITIIIDVGADILLLTSDLPQSVYPYTGKFSVKGEAAKGTGLAYVRKHFPGVPVRVVDVRSLRNNGKPNNE